VARIDAGRVTSIQPREAAMSMSVTTDASGRRATVCVSDDPHSAAALAELLPALRWTGTDEIVIDLSGLEAVDVRIAVVLAHAKRHHERLGRRVLIVCRPGADTRALQAVGLTPSRLPSRPRALAAASPSSPS
jgi:anti-anti-sigma regulatory factor